jgi:hypothetical protein
LLSEAPAAACYGAVTETAAMANMAALVAKLTVDLEEIMGIS